MNRDEAEATLERAGRRILRALALERWRVTFRVTEFESSAGECSADPRYEEALIEIDPRKIDDRDELLRVIRHECAHVMHAAFQQHRVATSEALSPQSAGIAQEAWSVGAEQTVLAIERAFDACGLTPARLEQIGEDLLAKAGG